MRKVTVDVVVKLMLDMDEDIEVTEVLENMDYNMISNTEGANIMDTEIMDWVVKDSR